MLIDSLGKDEMIIQVTNDWILLNHTLNVGYERTNIPKAFLNFTNARKIYWRVQQVGYDANTCTLELKVLNYEEGNYKSLFLQDPKHPIAALKFQKMDWRKLEPLLTSYTLGRITPLLYNLEQVHTSPVMDKPKRTFVAFTNNSPVTEPVFYKFDIPFKDATFNDGFVSLSKKIMGVTAQVKIVNPFLKSEFDYIKNWFCKKFGKETFNIEVDASLKRDESNYVIATSKEIGAINESFIASCRVHLIKDYINAKQEDGSKKVSTITDILTQNGKHEALLNDELLDGFKLYKEIMSFQQVRNEKQLDYLSSHPNVTNSKLRITAFPEPGFIFTFISKNYTCFVWELLNSHATYIWHFESKVLNENEMYNCLEEEVSKIFTWKRENYIKHQAEVKNPNFTFQRIFHVLKQNEENLGFEAWKKKIEVLIN